ncbi:unnamed protein product [Darwinula stevensoni]|uniref:Eukaryotic translation initiation factor 3 subunit L n=1 Tax=Darwinula stevensoni TaxID=69355 RepID=A0A7R9FNA5_9CRUS|nr:unnamed protein product [Darwinula stevensoni]CAG0896178.1 unnamed protein product [Darwinula stevensoni]
MFVLCTDPSVYFSHQYDTEHSKGYHLHTGDPNLDMENERKAFAQYIPDVVKNFVQYFYKAFLANNLYEIQNIYENSYPQMTDEYFKSTPWPEAEDIAMYVEENEEFLVLYQELFYRHIYAKVPGALDIGQRMGSYRNYCHLFNLILSAEHPYPLELPNQWLWDIIDEFIYQFQSWCQFRSRIQKKSKEELEKLAKHRNLWNVHSVLNVLHSLVEKSNINQQLEAYSKAGDPDAVAGEFGRHSLYKMLGYFSLIGLLRLHSLLGDYHQAIKVLENIELNKKSMYSRVPACQVTTYYYVGFAYMMMRRYADAIRTFSNILLYIQRTRQMFQSKSYQNDLINKQTEQMYILLGMCLVLHPQRIDESVMGVLREKPFADKMAKMQKGDVQEFGSNFSFACPKFLSPVAPSYDGLNEPLGNLDKEPLNLQLKVFMDEVQQQFLIPTIRSYLKLYTTIPVAKIAAFLDMSEEDFVTHLLCFKHKMMNVVWTKGISGLDGEFLSGSEVDFYVDKDMLHIADTKVARRYGDFFIRQIHKFQELNRTLKNLPFP